MNEKGGEGEKTERETKGKELAKERRGNGEEKGAKKARMEEKE
jgi:hypothetical protein